MRRAKNGQLALWLAACTLGASGLALVSSSPAGQEATAEAGGMSMREYQREETIDVEYSIATYQANEVMEDRHEVRETADGDVFAAVYDGHGGWQVAEYGATHVSRNLERELSDMSSHAPDQVSRALVRAFERTDRSLMHRVYWAFDMGMGALARVGACALALYVRGKEIYVANAGDCRAVLGRRLPDGSIAAEALTEDHNARIDKEQQALRVAHPDEPDIVRCKNPRACYVKGRLQPTRALGDAYLKYAEFNGPPGRGADKSAGRYIPPPYTPPYITATPEVTYASLDDPEMAGAEFVILASDGLWDILGNLAAARVVDRCIKKGERSLASQRLIERALEIKAEEMGWTIGQLRGLKPGRDRRTKHDDFTVVVVFLEYGKGEAEPQ